jgi:hypothetical protein
LILRGRTIRLGFRFAHRFLFAHPNLLDASLASSSFLSA